MSEPVVQLVRFTSPLPGEVDLLLAMSAGRANAPDGIVQRKSGEGALSYRETVIPHPSPLPTKSDISDFDDFICPTRVNPSWGGRGGIPPLPLLLNLI